MSWSSHMTQGNEKRRACLGVEISRVLKHVLRARVFSIGYLFSHLQLSPNSFSIRNIPPLPSTKTNRPSFPIALPNTSVQLFNASYLTVSLKQQQTNQTKTPQAVYLLLSRLSLPDLSPAFDLVQGSILFSRISGRLPTGPATNPPSHKCHILPEA